MRLIGNCEKTKKNKKKTRNCEKERKRGLLWGKIFMSVPQKDFL